jgi:ribosomal subunit interface protein
MPVEVQISFRHMDVSETLEALIRTRAAELEQLSDRIIACRVVVEAASKHHRHGNPYHVRVELSVPGNKVVVDRDPGNGHAHEDPYIAVRDAFEAARRRLQDHTRRTEGAHRAHGAPVVE